MFDAGAGFALTVNTAAVPSVTAAALFGATVITERSLSVIATETEPLTLMPPPDRGFLWFTAPRLTSTVSGPSTLVSSVAVSVSVATRTTSVAWPVNTTAGCAAVYGDEVFSVTPVFWPTTPDSARP